MKITAIPYKDLITKYPFMEEYLLNNGFELDDRQSLEDYLKALSEDEKEHAAIDINQALKSAQDYFEAIEEMLGTSDDTIESISIVSGTTKDGEKEGFDTIDLHPGEIIAIVGPTGSGKSRLLADIEWLARGDTPTNRKILINQELGDESLRFDAGKKIVAQLSQNMNFVMDLSVKEFLSLHAQSRMIENEEEVIERIIEKANELAGERFNPNSPITSLSGGQSRALMIADTAILSKSPIVLIDEIENAGIDRKKALDLLVGEDKIVLMATHDPILALMASKRLVISNGGISKILTRSKNEEKTLEALWKMDEAIQKQRSLLRYGNECIL